MSSYLSRVHVMSGSFAQMGADGRRAGGTFYLQKPGKVRFDYNPPSPIELIADGSSVVVRDRKLATQDLYPLSQTPLRFLLADHIDLLRDTNLVGIELAMAYREAGPTDGLHIFGKTGKATAANFERELVVLSYLPSRLTNAEIAAQLYVSLNTLKTHLRNIYRKLGVSGRREAIEAAERLGLA